MKIALVHDDLVQWGGAERVFINLCEVYPDADIYTSLFDKKNTFLNKYFKGRNIHTSFLQKVPGWKIFYRAFLPLYPIAFEQFDFSDYDLVISQTTRFAKSVITKPGTLHICYCHTPPRILWNFSGVKFSKIFDPFLNLLRYYDKISSKRVDFWIAGSQNASERIEKIYGSKSLVCEPFVDDLFFQSQKSFDGDYYLIISRLNKYKKVDIAVEVFNKSGKRLVVVGSGPQEEVLKSKAFNNIEFYKNISNELLVNLLSGCRGLIILAEEDFGLTALEAQAMGKPVIAYKKGGVLETVVEGKTGMFFESQTQDGLGSAVERFEATGFLAKDCVDYASRFSKLNFNQKFKKLVDFAYSSQDK